MLNNILNLDGVSVLDKKQQKKVHGGMIPEQGVCRFYYTAADGRTDQQTETVSNQASSADSAWANNFCLDALSMGWASCHYDCNYDGWGN